jgi:hypothetical protein
MPPPWYTRRRQRHSAAGLHTLHTNPAHIGSLLFQSETAHNLADGVNIIRMTLARALAKHDCIHSFIAFIVY